MTDFYLRNNQFSIFFATFSICVNLRITEFHEAAQAPFTIPTDWTFSRFFSEAFNYSMHRCTHLNLLNFLSQSKTGHARFGIRLTAYPLGVGKLSLTGHR